MSTPWQCISSKISSHNRQSELWSTCIFGTLGCFCLFVCFLTGQSLCSNKADPGSGGWNFGVLSQCTEVPRRFGYLTLYPDSNLLAFSCLMFFFLSCSFFRANISLLQFLPCSEPNLLFKYVHWFKPPDGPACSLLHPCLSLSSHSPRRFTSRIIFWKRYYYRDSLSEDGKKTIMSVGFFRNYYTFASKNTV